MVCAWHLHVAPFQFQEPWRSGAEWESVAREWRHQPPGRSMRWQCSARLRGPRPAAAAPWATLLALGLPGWVLAVSATAAAVVPEHHASTAGQPPLDWLLTDRGPFHRAQEYTDFVERYRQGFTTRYRIYRWVGLPSEASLGLHGCQLRSQLADRRLH